MFTVQYCIYWKKTTSEWPHTTQTHVVQGSTLYWDRGRGASLGSKSILAFGYIKWELSMKHPGGNINYRVGCVGLESKREVLLWESADYIIGGSWNLWFT